MSAADLQALVDRNLDAVTTKDAEGVLATFTDDAVLIDPHYPDPEMRGKAAIAAGLGFGFGLMRTFGFDERDYFPSPDGTSVVVHCVCHHVLQGGRPLTFPQVFVVRTRDGLIAHCQAFEPYGPGGVGGILLGLGKTVHRIRRAREQART
ncbi:nuclear transport factor 2 family protein [Amnibacterium sp. CER49]|uniref:nuclear transport factor 2 family protein n=1 Tax=Amnibacterium sp. CER49 TaxID=3039161 RepID=UPI002448D6D7|nr:nuclear transport factor 2 family protein [Amnibacterium sp. CER49]MDH2445403.1 nuclear transport factor 2 family protein [Amnibacterium sp. CER49]